MTYEEEKSRKQRALMRRLVVGVILFSPLVAMTGYDAKNKLKTQIEKTVKPLRAPAEVKAFKAKPSLKP